jgi:dipeptidyl aminopeptidase/acylaminoacyl peptidase
MRCAGALALLTAATLQLCGSVAFAQDASAAKVEEQVVGPAKQGITYQISPRGAHLALVTQKGSRFVVMVDGVEGPKFDDVLSTENGGKVLFSPDGTRFAYTGRSGQEYAVIVDGKELMRMGMSADQSGSSPVTQLAFTSNSKHVWFQQHVHKSNQFGDDYSCIVFDGVPGFPGGSTPIFSPDGDHFAYVATNPRDTNQQTMILDGKPAGYSGTEPLFTGDSKHLLVRTHVPLAPGRGQALQVLLDGKPCLKADDATLFVAPAGDLVAAAISRSTESGPRSFLVVAGKKIEGSESLLISQVAFSPDGKRYAAQCQTAASTQFVIVDGKKGQEYPSVLNLAFSEDSSHCVYRGMMGGKTFLVIDGEESDGYSLIQEFTFGCRGKRIGYIASTENSNADRIVVVDGAAAKQKVNQVSGLSFSSDGSRCAFLVGGGGQQHLDRSPLDLRTASWTCVRCAASGSSGGPGTPVQVPGHWTARSGHRRVTPKAISTSWSLVSA